MMQLCIYARKKNQMWLSFTLHIEAVVSLGTQFNDSRVKYLVRQ